MSEPTVEEMVEWWDKELYPELMRRVIWDFLDHEMFKAIRKRLEKPTVSREFVQRFFPCQCDSAYKDRGLTMPGCPYHDTGWEEMLTELDIIVKEE